MAALIVGLVIFLGLHSIKVAVPGWREDMVARLGEGPYRGFYSLVSLLGIILIVWGFARAWENPVFLYSPPSWGRHLAMALMLPALILALASALPAAWIRRFIRHPLLTGTMLWATAHLFANGDLAGVMLFAAFLVWAVIDWTTQPASPARAAGPRLPGNGDYAAIGAGLALYVALVAGLHFWLFGVSPVG